MKKTNPKIKQVKFDRLILFAEHLKTCKRKDYFIEHECENNRPPFLFFQNGISFIHFHFVCAELANMFPEYWAYYPNSYALYYVHNTDLNENDTFLDFFGITSHQRLHCFVPYLQQERFGGKPLFSHSKPYDVYYNIYSMLSVKSDWTKRMVLFEKYP